MKKGTKAFVIFLAVMLFFTVVSRVADSIVVPRVMTTEPSAKKIEHIVQANGIVEAGQEIPFLTEPGLLVKTVYVQAGERVAAGQLLAELVPEQLTKEIARLEDEIHIQRLQSEAAKSAKSVSAEARQRNKERAQADYDAALTEQAKAEENAGEEEKAAGDAFNHFLAVVGNGQLSGTTAEETEAEKQRLFGELQAKQKAREAAAEEAARKVEAAKRALEDASAKQPEDYTAEISEIQIAEKEKQLEGLKRLEEADGKLTAETDGTLTGVFLAAGQKTTDTAAFTMAVTEGDVRLTAGIGKSDAEYVQTGDAAAVEKGGRTYEDFVVSGIQQQADGSVSLTVKSEAHTADFSIGESAEIKVVKQSERYPTAIPLSALHTDADGDYVYLLVTKETVLGSQLTAERLSVNVLDKNSSYAALEEGILGIGQKIIADSERYISAGSRVRLEGN